MGWTPTGLSVNERALWELAKAIRVLDRMSKPRTFYCSDLSVDWSYRPLSAKNPASLVGECYGCGRPSIGNQCRECFHGEKRDEFFEKVYAEEARVDLFKSVFNRVAPTMEVHMGKKSSKEAAPIIRSTSGLREALFDEMEALRNGNSNAQRARSVAQMANAILQSVTVEIEYHKYVNSAPRQVQGETKVVALGTNIPLVQEKAAA